MNTNGNLKKIGDVDVPMDYKVNFRNNFPQQIQLLQIRRNNRSSFSFNIIIWNLCKDVVRLILILLNF